MKITQMTRNWSGCYSAWGRICDQHYVRDPILQVTTMYEKNAIYKYMYVSQKGVTHIVLVTYIYLYIILF